MYATELQRRYAAAKRALARAERELRDAGEWPTEIGTITDRNNRPVATAAAVASPDWSGAAKLAGHETAKQFCESRGITPDTRTTVRVTWH